jgi:hypothetical protein
MFGNAVPDGGVPWQVAQLERLSGQTWHVEQDGPLWVTPVKLGPWQETFEQAVVPFALA